MEIEPVEANQDEIDDDEFLSSLMEGYEAPEESTRVEKCSVFSAKNSNRDTPHERLMRYVVEVFSFFLSFFV